MAILRTGRAAQRGVVEIESDRRGIAAARGHTAHLDFGLTGSFALQRDARCCLCEAGERGDAAGLKIGAAGGSDADGRVLDGGNALLRGHDHFIEFCGIGGISGREGARIQRTENSSRAPVARLPKDFIGSSSLSD